MIFQLKSSEGRVSSSIAVAPDQVRYQCLQNVNLKRMHRISEGSSLQKKAYLLKNEQAAVAFRVELPTVG